jgi:hypothetical protein
MISNQNTIFQAKPGVRSTSHDHEQRKGRNSGSRMEDAGSHGEADEEAWDRGQGEGQGTSMRKKRGETGREERLQDSGERQMRKPRRGGRGKGRRSSYEHEQRNGGTARGWRLGDRAERETRKPRTAGHGGGKGRARLRARPRKVEDRG